MIQVFNNNPWTTFWDPLIQIFVCGRQQSALYHSVGRKIPRCLLSRGLGGPMKRKLSYLCRQLKPVPRSSGSWRSNCPKWDILSVTDNLPTKRKRKCFCATSKFCCVSSHNDVQVYFCDEHCLIGCDAV